MENKVYRYQKHIRHWPYTVCIFIGTYVALFAVPSLSLFLRGTTDPMQIGVFLAFIFLVSLAGGGLLAFLCYQSAKTEVSIEDDALVYSTRSKTWRIPLKEIVALKLPSIKYAGGWVKIVTPSKSVRLTMAIEDLAEFLLELKGALDAQELSDRYDRNKFFQFLKAATFGAQSWVRMCQLLWKLILTVTLLGAVGLAFDVALELGKTGVALLIFGPLAMPLIVYLCAEFEIGRRFEKATDEKTLYCPAPDIELENKVYREAAWTCGVVYLVAVVIVALAVFWGWDIRL